MTIISILIVLLTVYFLYFNELRYFYNIKEIPDLSLETMTNASCKAFLLTLIIWVLEFVIYSYFILAILNMITLGCVIVMILAIVRKLGMGR